MLSSSGVSQPAWLKNDFSAVSGQLLLPLARHGDSCFWQVACLSPGTDVSQFCSMPLVTSLPLVDDIVAAQGPFFREKGSAVLSHCRKGDKRVRVENGRARRLRMLGKETEVEEEEEEVLESLQIGEKFL